MPSGTEIAFRYKKPDGTAGFYDALPNNSPAITISGNTVTVELVEQVLTVSGCVHCEINMYNATSEKLTTFTFEISVEESVLTDAEIISSDYYNVLTAEIAKALQAVTDATEQAENAAQSAQEAADSAAMSKDWAAGQPVTYNGTPVSIAYAGTNRIASITAYGETPQGGTTEAPVALTGVDSVLVCGNNLLPKATKTQTIYGITFTPNPDGSILVSGTATTNVGYSYARFKRALLGRTVCLSGGSTQAQVLINERLSSGAFVRNVLVDRGQGVSGTLTKQKEDNILYVTIQVLAGTTVNTTIYPMLNLGESPLPYEPYQGNVTQLPIPRPLHKVGDVKDVCRTRVKSVYDKRIVLDGTEIWTEYTDENWQGAGYHVYRFYDADALLGQPIVSNKYPSRRGSSSFKGTLGVASGGQSILFSVVEQKTVEDWKAYLAAQKKAGTPLIIYRQSTAYDGTNGLDVCLMKYQNDFVELDGTENWALHSTIANAFYCDNIMPGIFTNNAKKDFVICSSAQQNAYINVTILTNGEFAIGTSGNVIRAVFKDTSCATAEAWKAKLAENHVQIAYQLATPEVCATDPVDFDNAAGPLIIMTGGELEVRMTELVGSRSDVSNNTVAFSEAAQDADIQTEETLSTLFGKIKKRFSVITTTFAKLSNLAYGNEVDTGLTWLDGKKIYRKTAKITPSQYAVLEEGDPVTYTATVENWMVGINEICMLQGMLVNLEGYYLPLGAKRNGNNDYGGYIAASIENNIVKLTIGTGARPLAASNISHFTVICEYTKI